MVVGEPPFTGPNVQSVIAKRFVRAPADVATLRHGIPLFMRSQIATTRPSTYIFAADPVSGTSPNRRTGS